MRNTAFMRKALLLAAVVLFGASMGARWIAALHAQQPNPPTTPATMQADVTRLRDIVPPNSHPMVDVGYHATNLWFAAQRKNWPLAGYYLNETRNRMRWEVRLNPSPKDASGQPVDMKSTLDGIEAGSFDKVKQAIDKKDSAAFTVAYKHLLEDCYSCHKAAGRAYLRPMVPVTPGQAIINTDPGATWPQ